MPQAQQEIETLHTGSTSDAIVTESTPLVSRPPAQVIAEWKSEKLQRLLAQAQVQKKRFHRARFWLLGITLVALLPLVTIDQSQPWSRFICLVTLADGIIMQWCRKQCMGPMKELAHTDDVRAVGQLVEMFEILKQPDQTFAKTALIRLFPRLKMEDAPLLEESQRAVLRRYLAGSSVLFVGREPDLIVAILKAYEQVGDGNDLLVVEKLAHGKGLGADNRVQAAALACLPHLQQRIEQIQNPQTLLRASSNSEAPAETLLRAAEGNPEGDPEELLRASD